jgi:hypothetical protein
MNRSGGRFERNDRFVQIIRLPVAWDKPFVSSVWLPPERQVILMRTLTRTLLTGAACAALLAAPAWATLRIQNEAVERGFAGAGNCGYCHTFDGDHIKNAAKKQNMSIRGHDCYPCHGRSLPKKGTWLLNDRGLYLVNAKRHLGAERVNVEWLSAYKEPSAAKNKRAPGPTAQK